MIVIHNGLTKILLDIRGLIIRNSIESREKKRRFNGCCFFETLLMLFATFDGAKSKEVQSSTADIKPRAKFVRTPSSYLEEDYVLLIELYHKIYSEGYKVRDYQAMLRYLRDFKSAFQEYLIKESAEFHSYLQKNFEDDMSALEVVKDFRGNLNSIATTVISFCDKYKEPTLIVSNAYQFDRDYQEVGRVLSWEFGLLTRK